MTCILCLGEAMAEIRNEGDGFAVVFTRDTFNTAVYCCRRLRGGTVGFQTRIGYEPLSEGFLRLADLRATGQRVAFDSNLRLRLWPDVATARQVIAQAWALADIALPPVDDEMALFGDADAAAVLARLQQLGVREGALKRGAVGPLALQPVLSAPAFAPTARVGLSRPAAIVDTPLACAIRSSPAAELTDWIREVNPSLHLRVMHYRPLAHTGSSELV